MSPYEKVFGHAPSISHLRVFSSKCFIKIPDETRTKLDDKAKECRLIGFESDSIYVVVDQERKKQRSRNAIFIEGMGHQSNEGKMVEFSNQEDKTKMTIRNMKAKPRHDKPGLKYGEQNRQGDQSVFKIKRPIIRSSSLRPSEMRTHPK